jgi:DNA-binding beta-propeller fold protein YncE
MDGMECGGVAVSRDGSTLLVSDCSEVGSHAIHEIVVADGSHRSVIGRGTGPLQLDDPGNLCIAPDGFVFVADYGNDRVQVLTPALDFHCTIGEGLLSSPLGVVANADVVVVSEHWGHRIAVFSRGDGAFLRRIGAFGFGAGKLQLPRGLCFVSGDRHVAVADSLNHRVSVFSVAGEFIRHVGVGVLASPQGIAASAFDELVVADGDNKRLHVFSNRGDLLATVGKGEFTGVAVHGSRVFAVDVDAATVSVLE